MSRCRSVRLSHFPCNFKYSFPEPTALNTANASGMPPHRRRTVTYMGQTTKTIKFTKVKLNRKTGEAGGREEENQGGRATTEGEGERMEGLIGEASAEEK